MRRPASYLLATLLALPASAAECPTGKAIYGQEESGWRLVFRPVPEENTGGDFTNAFVLEVPVEALTLSGTVNWTNGFTQPWGEVFVDCGDEDGAWDCLTWEGTVYGVEDGVVAHIAGENAPAPEQVLLPGLGPALWQSMLRHAHGVEEMPWDVFTFRACGD